MEPSTPVNPTPVSSKEVDYLEEDKPLRGQNYVCLSFISPEDVLHNKEVYYFEKYLGQFSKDLSTLFDGLTTRYPNDADIIKGIREANDHLFSGDKLQDQFRFFKSVNGGEIEREFHEKNNFQTSIRGIKVRGVFDTLREAQIRADVLKKMGDKFDIFVGQVGCWCPWSPNPEDLADQQYSDTMLNTLMQKYKENMTVRDQVFEERKQAKMAEAAAAVAAAGGDAGASTSGTAPEGAQDATSAAVMEGVDPWSANKSS